MRKEQKDFILMDCKIMMKKFGDIPFDLVYKSGNFQKELRNIGDKYGVSGPEVFKLFMESFSKEGA